MKKWLNTVGAGAIIGVLGLFVGFILFGAYFCLKNGTSFKFFYERVYLEFPYFKTKITTVAIMFDILPFYLFMRRDYYKTCQGILGIIMVAVILTIFFFE